MTNQKARIEMLRVMGISDEGAAKCFTLGNKGKGLGQIRVDNSMVNECTPLNNAARGDIVIVEMDGDNKIIAVKNIVSEEFVGKFLGCQQEKIQKIRNLVTHAKGFMAVTLILSVAVSGFLVSLETMRVLDGHKWTPFYQDDLGIWVVLFILMGALSEWRAHKKYNTSYEKYFDALFTTPAKWIYNKVKGGKPR